MTELVSLAISVDEAKVITERIRNNLSDVRKDLLLMWQTEAWRQLDYNSWHEYLTAEFTHHHSYLRRQTHAALLESQLADDGSMIGQHIESHMRPLIEILPDEELRIDAYWTVQDRYPDPVARDYELVAKEVALMNGPYAILKTRFRAGYIGIVDAYAISQELTGYTFTDDNHLITVASNCNDPALVRDISRLYEAQTDTWQEILVTNCIPAYDEPIPLRRATAANLRAWLDVTSAEHRAAAIEGSREYYARRAQLINELIDALGKYHSYLPEPIIEAYERYIELQTEGGDKDGTD